MLSGLIVWVLLVGAMASKPGMPFGTMYGRPTPKPSEENHEPCCAPRYFTFDQVITSTYVLDGSLKVEYVNLDGAYDAIEEIYSFKEIDDFFNGTVNSFQIISDFKEGVRYEIEKTGDEIACYVTEVEERKFPNGCVPEDAVYVGEVVLGDHDLLVDNWYFSNPEKTTHVLKTVQVGSCVPVAAFSREFDPETGKEVAQTDSRLFNFNLGICDRDEYFKVPEVCKEGRALKKPTPKMLKEHRRGLFY